MVEDEMTVHERVSSMTWGHIEKYGRSIISTVDEAGVSFSYTVGNSLKDLPELIVFRLDPHIAHRLLNHMSDHMLAHGAFPANEEVRFEKSLHPIMLLAVSPAKDNHTHVVRRVLAKPVGTYKVLQIVICDKKGKFPWEAGCNPQYRKQPILSGKLN